MYRVPRIAYRVKSTARGTRYFVLYSGMPSFDIVSKVDPQMLDNAVNVTRKEITNRFDFKDSHVVIDLNKKDLKIDVETDDDIARMSHSCNLSFC